MSTYNDAIAALVTRLDSLTALKTVVRKSLSTFRIEDYTQAQLPLAVVIEPASRVDVQPGLVVRTEARVRVRVYWIDWASDSAGYGTWAEALAENIRALDAAHYFVDQSGMMTTLETGYPIMGLEKEVMIHISHSLTTF